MTDTTPRCGSTTDARKRLAEKASTPDHRDALVEALTGMTVRVQVPNAGTMSGFLRRESAEELASVLPIFTTPAERDRQVAAKAWDEGNAACCEPAYVHLNPYRADRIANQIEGGGEDA